MEKVKKGPQGYSMCPEAQQGKGMTKMQVMLGWECKVKFGYVTLSYIMLHLVMLSYFTLHKEALIYNKLHQVMLCLVKLGYYRLGQVNTGQDSFRDLKLIIT